MLIIFLLIVAGVVCLALATRDDGEPLDQLHQRQRVETTAVGDWYERKRAEQRAQRNQALNHEATTYIQTTELHTYAQEVAHRQVLVEQDTRFEQSVHEDRLNRQETEVIRVHENVLLGFENDKMVLEDALTAGLPRGVYEQITLLAKQNELEVERVRQLAEVEVQTELDKARTVFTAITAYKLIPVEQVEKIRLKLNDLVEERAHLRRADKPRQVKAEQLAYVDEAIRTLEELYRAQQHRLLEAGDREDTAGRAAIAELVGRAETSGEGTPHEVPPADAGDER